ncbi:uncharacterized protein LOC143034339 [Oratosquilla oratoria]|uniref:uncharacterized protein LOC143034339 n=1 Tax=Oratosquilla oratoria TaxID=337810 RepID=UPI003F75A794
MNKNRRRSLSRNRERRKTRSVTSEDIRAFGKAESPPPSLSEPRRKSEGSINDGREEVSDKNQNKLASDVKVKEKPAISRVGSDRKEELRRRLEAKRRELSREPSSSVEGPHPSQENMDYSLKNVSHKSPPSSLDMITPPEDPNAPNILTNQTSNVDVIKDSSNPQARRTPESSCSPKTPPSPRSPRSSQTPPSPRSPRISVSPRSPQSPKSPRSSQRANMGTSSPSRTAFPFDSTGDGSVSLEEKSLTSSVPQSGVDSEKCSVSVEREQSNVSVPSGELEDKKIINTKDHKESVDENRDTVNKITKDKVQENANLDHENAELVGRSNKTLTSGAKERVHVPYKRRSVQLQANPVRTVSRQCQTQDTELIEQDHLKKELAAQEERYQKQVDQLTIALAEKQENVSQMQKKIEELKQVREQVAVSEETQKRLDDLGSEVKIKTDAIDTLTTELQYTRNEAELTKNKLQQVEGELEETRTSNSQLQTQLNQAAKAEKMEELESRISKLEEQLKEAEEEKQKLEKNLSEIELEREEEIKIIQDALDEAAQEREELITTFEKEMQNVNTINTSREQQLLEDFEWKLREMEKEHKKKMDEKERMCEERLGEVRSMVESELADSLTKLSEDRRIADEKMQEVIHLKSYEAEAIQLRGVTYELQKALRCSAREMEQHMLRYRLLEEELRSYKKGAQSRQQSTLHRAKRAADDVENEFRHKIEKMKNELNAEWEDKLRSECSRLKGELDDLHSEEKHLAVESMKVQKEQEIQTLKQSWELKQEEMTKEISTLKDSLTDKDAYYHKELETQRTNADRDIWELRRKLIKLDETSYNQQEYLTEKHRDEMERLRSEYEQRVSDLEATLASQQNHRYVESKWEIEKMYKDQMEHLGQQHRLSMERLREELEAEKFQAVEEARVILARHNESIIQTLREQLTEAVTGNTQYREELDAIRLALSRREEVIRTLEDEVNKIRNSSGNAGVSSASAASSAFSASQYSLASSTQDDSRSSQGSSNSQDRLSIGDDGQDDAHKAGIFYIRIDKTTKRASAKK